MAKQEKESTKKIGGSKILRCNCNSSFQDAVYGLGMRLHNIGKEKSTCTVCGAKK